MKKIVLYSGGVLNIFLAIFHVLFWEMLDWKDQLSKISEVNAAILKVENIIIIFLLLYFAVISFILARIKKYDFFAKAVIFLIAGFYLLRLAAGYPFFGFSYVEISIWFFCVIMIIGYSSLLFYNKEPEITR